MAINAADDQSAKCNGYNPRTYGKAAENGADATVSLLSWILKLLTWSMDKLVSAVSKILFGLVVMMKKKINVTLSDKISESESTVKSLPIQPNHTRDLGVQVTKI